MFGGAWLGIVKPKPKINWVFCWAGQRPTCNAEQAFDACPIDHGNQKLPTWA